MPEETPTKAKGRAVWNKLYGDQKPPDPAREAVIAVMREMTARRSVYVADLGSPTTLVQPMCPIKLASIDQITWTLDLLRKALDLPYGWETVGT